MQSLTQSLEQSRHDIVLVLVYEWKRPSHVWVLLELPNYIAVLYLLLFSVVRFVFSSFVAKAGVKWAQPSCHWVSCYKNFSVSMRQTAPGSLHASSRLELALSLSLSLALCSLLFKSHRYIRKFSVLCVQSFPLPLLLKDVVYLPSDSCHYGTLATATFTLCMERCRLPTLHRSQESQNTLFLLLLHIWSCAEFLISKSSLFWAFSDLSLWLLDSVLQEFKSLLIVDNIEILFYAVLY